MDKRIKKAYDFIKRRYRDKILLSKLAREVGISPFHFQRLYKQQMNETPAASVVRIRLERARHLLVLDASVSLSKIASDCGFSSLSAFSRAFAMRYGQPATSYARKLRSHHILRDSAPLLVRVASFPGAVVLYEHTSMLDGNLVSEFQKAEAVCHKKKLKVTGRKFGIMTHLAFHSTGSQELNYYAGVEIDKDRKNAKGNEDLYEIPKGSYAIFSTAASHHQLWDVFMKFKIQWLDFSRYVISDTFAFEEIHENAGDGQRNIYVPVRLKTRK